jgi:hypothetical protein
MTKTSPVLFAAEEDRAENEDHSGNGLRRQFFVKD